MASDTLSGVPPLVRKLVAFVDHQHLRQLIQDHPRIGDALWRDTLIDAAVFREWLVGVRRRSAYSRIAHLFCELISRMQAVELADGLSIRLLIGQGTIGAALGLSTVHVNRVVQQLRADQLIVWKSGTFAVTDWEGLQRAGDFDPTYLHLHQGKAA